MKIYTRTGDDGTTSLFSGGRVLKAHLRVEAYGTIDELNSMLGVVRAHQPHADTNNWLERIQNQLFHLGADLATPLDSDSPWVVRVDPVNIAWLESLIDQMTDDLPPLSHFILPGGSIPAAHLHVARTICRRAERVTVELAENETIGPHVIEYINRLSDFLFVLSRWENAQSGVSETEWRPRTSP